MLIDQGWKHSIMASRSKWLVRGLSALTLALVAAAPPSDALARRAPAVEAQQTSLAVAPLSSLPEQARETHRHILAGGPFPYTKDGIVFGNRERTLPYRARGFYREYTVRTPGSRDRGPRRIVCGGKEAQRPETCFYTEDHYTSFRIIDPRH